MPPSCDKAALRILGLSMAGWNAIASLVLAIIALRGAVGKAVSARALRKLDNAA